MWYRLTLMTGKWYAKEVDPDDVLDTHSSDGRDLEELVQSGTVVAFCDDLETFCDEMDLDIGDIITVEDSD